MNKKTKSVQLVIACLIGGASLVCGLLFLSPSPDVAAQVLGTAADSAGVTNPETGSFFSESMAAGSLIRTLLALLAVIGCIYLGVWLLKRFSRGTIGGGGNRPQIDILSTRHVGPRKSISLIKVADRAILIGVTEQQMTTLTELTADETTQLLGSTTQEEPRPAFANWLSNAKGQMHKAAASGTSVTAA